MRKSRATNLLLINGLALEAAFEALIGLGNLTRNSGQYLFLFIIMFLLYLAATLLVLGRLGAANNRANDLPTTLLIILFLAFLFRFTVLFAAPTLSTDQFRYTWEGRLVTQGISPYRYAPDDPALASYRSGIWPLVQQRETASPYPPLSQLIGAGEYWIFGDSLLGPKIVAVFFDLLNCLALLWLLQILRRDTRLVLLYAWCPLPIIEFGQSGHNDAPMLFFLLLAVGLAIKGRPALSSFILGLASLAKFTPLFGLPLFLVDWAGKPPPGEWRAGLLLRRWRYPVLTVAVVLAGYAPFVIWGGGAIGSVLDYTGSWRDNESLFFGFAYDFLGPSAAKLASVLVLGVVVLVLSFHPGVTGGITLPRRLMLVFGTTLMVASTVHVWYLTWILVFLPLVYGEGRFKSWDKAWLLFSVTVQLTYLTYAGDVTLYNWIKYVEYGPLYALVARGVFGEIKRVKLSAGKTRLPLLTGEVAQTTSEESKL